MDKEILRKLHNTKLALKTIPVVRHASSLGCYKQSHLIHITELINYASIDYGNKKRIYPLKVKGIQFWVENKFILASLFAHHKNSGNRLMECLIKLEQEIRQLPALLKLLMMQINKLLTCTVS